MKTSTYALLAAATLSAGTAATAGSLDPVVVDPTPTAPVVVEPVALGGDWTGPYAGLSFGTANIKSDNGDTDTGAYSGFLGYDYDFGDFVVGGEYEFLDGNDTSFGGVDVNNMQRLKLKGGYDLGQALVYATAGPAFVNADQGNDTGAFGGVGVDYKLTDNFSVGGEALHHSFKEIGDTNVDVTGQTYMLRGTFRF
jgi:opacity protein-like surface antigen